MAELMIGQPLFKGNDTQNQMLQIVKLLGTPSSADIKAMNPLFQLKSSLPNVVGEGIAVAMHRIVKESNKGGSLDEKGVELVK